MTGKRRDVIFLGAALAVVVAIGVWFTVRDDGEPSADPDPTPTVESSAPSPSDSGSASASVGPPTSTPPPSTPATTSPTTPTVAPSPVTERSRAAARQAGEAWFKALSWAITAGDVAPVKAVSDSSCKACTNFLGTIEPHLSADAELHSKPIVMGHSTVSAYNGTQALIVCDMTWGQLIVHSKSSGKEIYRSEPPKPATLTIKLGWVSQQWQALAIGTGRPK